MRLYDPVTRSGNEENRKIFSRIVNILNSRPAQIVNSNTVESFKKKQQKKKQFHDSLFMVSLSLPASFG